MERASVDTLDLFMDGDQVNGILSDILLEFVPAALFWRLIVFSRLFPLVALILPKKFRSTLLAQSGSVEKLSFTSTVVAVSHRYGT